MTGYAYDQADQVITEMVSVTLARGSLDLASDRPQPSCLSGDARVCTIMP